MKIRRLSVYREVVFWGRVGSSFSTDRSLRTGTTRREPHDIYSPISIIF